MKIYLLLIFILIIPMIVLSFSPSMSYTHPLILGSIMFLFTIMMSINMSMMYDNSMLAIIMFLIVVGGLLVMFMYFTSFAMNNKMISNTNFFKYWFIKFILIYMIMLIIKYKLTNTFLLMLMSSIPNIETSVMNFKFEMPTNMIYLLYEDYGMLTIFGMSYVFYSMIIIVKMIYYNTSKSIRKKSLNK